MPDPLDEMLRRLSDRSEPRGLADRVLARLRRERRRERIRDAWRWLGIWLGAGFLAYTLVSAGLDVAWGSARALVSGFQALQAEPLGTSLAWLAALADAVQDFARGSLATMGFWGGAVAMLALLGLLRGLPQTSQGERISVL